MSAVTGNVKFGINYPVYVTTTPYNLPAYDFNYVISNVSSASVINLPPVSSVPNGWTVLIKNNNNTSGNNITVNANGTDTFNPTGTQTIAIQTYTRYLANHSSTGNSWTVI